MEDSLTEDEDFLDLVNILNNYRERRPQVFRQRENHFTKWNDKDFIARFRISKIGVNFLMDQISHIIASPTERNHAVSPVEMILMTLRLYATGSFLQVIGDFVGVDKSTISRHTWTVTKAIASLYPRFVKMPKTNDEMIVVANRFYELSRFPKCIGALDCTHVKIISPGGEDAEIYRNRKGFFSFNVQAVCDANCMFEDIVCRWPGSSHDSQIFANSLLRRKFETGVYKDFLLLGDSGYAVKSYLIPPLDNHATPAEQLFNESQIRTRNAIERSFGIWKRRFPILSFGIRQKQNKVEGIVIATAVLHNIAKILKEPEPPVNIEEEAVINFVNDILRQNLRQINILHFNYRVRRQLIDNYFNALL